MRVETASPVKCQGAVIVSSNPGAMGRLATLGYRLRAHAALAGCCAYLITFALPLDWDLSLLLLAFGVLASPRAAAISSQGRRATLLAIALLTATSIASVVFSPNASRSALGAAATLPAVLLCGTICYRIGPSDIRALLMALLMLALVASGSALLGYALDTSGDPSRWIGAYSRVMAVPNDTLLLAVLSPVLVGILLTERAMTVRLLALSALLMGIAVIVLARSRLGLITLVVGQSITLLSSRSRSVGIVILAVLAISVLADAAGGFPLARKFTSATGESRFALWWAAWQMFLSAPFVGHGVNMFGVLYPDVVQSFPLESTVLRVDRFYVPWPHNLYLELLAERGGFAFGAFVAMLVVSLGSAWNSTRHGGGALGAALLGAIVGLALAGIAELSMLHLWTPVLAFTLFGIATTLESGKVRE